MKHDIPYRSTADRAQDLHYPSFPHLPLFSSASLATMILKLCRHIGTMIARATIAGRLSSLLLCIYDAPSSLHFILSPLRLSCLCEAFVIPSLHEDASQKPSFVRARIMLDPQC